MRAQYQRVLQIVGVGYKANALQHPKDPHKVGVLILKLGFSHDITLTIPPSIRVYCLKPTLITIRGLNLQPVTQFATLIKSLKPPEVYKGKGIRFIDEKVLQKQGKKK